MRVMTRRPTPLGVLLRTRRQASKTGFKQLTAATGLEPETLRKWEVGEISEPPFRGVLIYARVVGIPLEELVEAALGEASAAHTDPRDPPIAREGSAAVASARADKRAASKRQPRRAHRPPGA